MKVTILGNNGPFPGENGACSGYLVQSGNTKILVDCGNGTLANLQKYSKISDVSLIILSHLHNDHIGDMGVLKYAVTVSRIRLGEKPIESIKVYCPNSPQKEFESLDREAFEVNILSEDTRINLNEIEISFKKVVHPYECYAVKFTTNGKVLVYSGDTAYTENLIEFVKDADLFIGDAGFTNMHNTGKPLVHMTAEQNAIIAKQANVKKLLLSHFWPYDDTSVHLKEAKVVFENTEVSAIGKSYIV